ncbi:MAG: META domain-containing protein [Paracoccus sp. (in: a-proteobacteria)]|nr:META domain-containing protein [Paracoccus sp. (in: a-proteobacteria)]
MRPSIIAASAVIALAACAAPELDEAEIIDGVDWKLMAVGGVPYHFDVSLRLDGARLTGIGPCNVYSGNVTSSPPDFAVSEIGATEMACEPGRMRAESDYFAALSRADRIARDGRGLVLTGPNALRLDFERREARGDQVF